MSTNPDARTWWTTLTGLMLPGSAPSSAVAWWIIAAPVAFLATEARHVERR